MAPSGVAHGRGQRAKQVSPAPISLGRLDQRQSPTPQKRLQSGFESPVGYQLLLSPSGKASALHADMTRFDSGKEHHFAGLAQLEERVVDIHEVAGS